MITFALITGATILALLILGVLFLHWCILEGIKAETQVMMDNRDE